MTISTLSFMLLFTCSQILPNNLELWEGFKLIADFVITGKLPWINNNSANSTNTGMSTKICTLTFLQVAYFALMNKMLLRWNTHDQLPASSKHSHAHFLKYCARQITSYKCREFFFSNHAQHLQTHTYFSYLSQSSQHFFTICNCECTAVSTYNGNYVQNWLHPHDATMIHTTKV